MSFNLEIVETVEMTYFKSIKSPHIYVPELKSEDHRDKFTEHVHKYSIIKGKNEFISSSVKEIVGIVLTAESIDDLKTKYKEAFEYALIVVMLMGMPGVKEDMTNKIEARHKLKTLYGDPDIGR